MLSMDGNMALERPCFPSHDSLLKLMAELAFAITWLPYVAFTFGATSKVSQAKLSYGQATLCVRPDERGLSYMSPCDQT